MNRIAKHLKSDLRDETMANRGYKKLAKQVRKELGKGRANIVLGIARDEADHHKKLTKIQKDLGKKLAKKS